MKFDECAKQRVRQLTPFLKWYVVRVNRAICSFKMICNETYIDEELTELAFPTEKQDPSNKRRCAQKEVAELRRPIRNKTIPFHYDPEDESNDLPIFFSPFLRQLLETNALNKRSSSTAAPTPKETTPARTPPRTTPTPIHLLLQIVFQEHLQPQLQWLTLPLAMYTMK